MHQTADQDRIQSQAEASRRIEVSRGMRYSDTAAISTLAAAEGKAADSGEAHAFSIIQAHKIKKVGSEDTSSRRPAPAHVRPGYSAVDAS